MVSSGPPWVRTWTDPLAPSSLSSPPSSGMQAVMEQVTVPRLDLTIQLKVFMRQGERTCFADSIVVQKYAPPKAQGQTSAPAPPKARPGPPPPKPKAATPAAPSKPKNPAELRREEERQQVTPFRVALMLPGATAAYSVHHGHETHLSAQASGATRQLAAELGTCGDPVNALEVCCKYIIPTCSVHVESRAQDPSILSVSRISR